MSAVGAVIGGGRRVGAALDDLAANLVPWGGDGGGRWGDDGDGAGLIHVRADLTPEDGHDRQPLVDPTGRWVVAVHCRLDGRAALARRLGLAPTEVARVADSHLVALAWSRWGDDLPRQLLGGFAVLVWDRLRRSMWMACDTAGECPLHWTRTATGVVAVASHASALAAMGGVRTGPDVDRLAVLSAGRRRGDPDRTFLQGITRLLPAHSALVDARGNVRTSRYWQPPPAPPARGPRPDESEAWDRLRAVFDTAVADRLRPAGTAAAHCSGGLDSSAVAATAATLLAPGGDHVHAFTAVPDARWPLDPADDDRPYIAALAERHGNLRLHPVTAGGSLLDVLEPLTAALAGPVRHGSNAVWLHAIDRSAIDVGARVVLVGQAGNATLSHAGVDPVRAALRHRGPAAAWREVAVIAARRRRSRAWVAARHLALPRSEDQRSTWCRWLDRDARTAAAHAGSWVLTGVRRLDPTADRRLVEAIAALPAGILAADGDRRRGVREALADRLPPEITQQARRGRQSIDASLHLGAVLPAVIDRIEEAAGDERFRSLVDVAAVRTSLAGWPPPSAWTPSDQARVVAVERALALAAFLRWADRPTLPVTTRPCPP